MKAQTLRRGPLSWLTLLLILVQPIFSISHYFWNDMAGAYPINADSIGIPIFREIISWIFLAPVALIGAFWALTRHFHPIPLLKWNEHRPIWSSIWTGVFALLLLVVLGDIPFNLRWVNVPSLLNDGLWIYIFLQLRALVVAKEGWR
jgi:hypothetical protein